MASACVNNTIGDKSFLPWDPEPDFEFRLQDPVAMLPADQLFSDGKLVPLHLKPSSSSAAGFTAAAATSVADSCLFSPKAPRCSSRWKDLLGLKKLYQSTNTSSAPSSHKTTAPSSKSLKHFLHRPKSESSSLSLPLLKDSDCESLSISSSRLSLSSSSSGHDHDDLPRLSLDSEKPNANPNQNPNPNPISIHRTSNNHPRVRLVKQRAGSFDGNKTDQQQQQQNPVNRAGRSPIRKEQQSGTGTGGCRGVSVDSPRMNSSGKIVFQSLERSSSSPGSFTGGPRFKHRGMERSYSANVRVTPVLNVPVCSLRGGSKSGSVFGFGQLFSSPQKKDTSTTANNRSHHQHGVRNRSDRN